MMNALGWSIVAALSCGLLRVCSSNVLSGSVSQSDLNLQCPNLCSGHGICVSATVSQFVQGGRIMCATLTSPASPFDNLLTATLIMLACRAYMHRPRVCATLVGAPPQTFSTKALGWLLTARSGRAEVAAPGTYYQQVRQMFLSRSVTGVASATDAPGYALAAPASEGQRVSTACVPATAVGTARACQWRQRQSLRTCCRWKTHTSTAPTQYVACDVFCWPIFPPFVSAVEN